MFLSIIVPTLNEIGVIGGLLAQLETLEGDFEVVFGDGGSTDGTLEAIGGRWPVVACDRGRAVQMNRASAQSHGEALLFLHCDCGLPADAVAQIRAVLEAGYRAGCFRLAFDSPRLVMKCCAFFSNLRVKYRHIMFGDQGIFVERALFEQVGGFPELPLMEDYQLSMTLKNICPIGQAAGKIVTSARRFEAGGPLRTMWRMQRLQWMYRHGAPIQRIAALYRNVR